MPQLERPGCCVPSVSMGRCFIQSEHVAKNLLNRPDGLRKWCLPSEELHQNDFKLPILEVRCSQNLASVQKTTFGANEAFEAEDMGPNQRRHALMGLILRVPLASEERQRGGR